MPGDDSIGRYGDFVSDFDKEVGLIRKTNRMIANETENWPEFCAYDPGDHCILYELEMPLPFDCYPPKLYDKIGFYVWLFPADWENQGSVGTDITGGLQFRHKGSGSMLNADEWKSMEDEHFHRKTKLVKAHQIDPDHWKLGVDTMNKFVYEKLVPILYRKDPSIRLKTEPPKSMYDEVVESIISDLLNEYETPKPLQPKGTPPGSPGPPARQVGPRDADRLGRL